MHRRAAHELYMNLLYARGLLEPVIITGFGLIRTLSPCTSHQNDILCILIILPL